MAAALGAQVRHADPNLPVFDMKTMERQIDEDPHRRIDASAVGCSSRWHQKLDEL
jgi:hypothetical protein